MPIDIVATPERLAEKLYLMEFPLTMEAGSHSVAVGIRDDFGPPPRPAQVRPLRLIRSRQP